MGNNFFRVKKGGLNIKPQASPAPTESGDITVDSSSNKASFYNGTSSSPLVTETHASQGANRITNKDLDDTTTRIVDSSDTTKKIALDAAGTTGTTTTVVSSQTTNRTLTLPDATDTLVGKATTDSLTNKTLVDNSTAIADNSDATKQIKFDAGGTTGTSTTITAAQTADRVITLPDATTTLLGTDTTQTLTNKSLVDATTSIIDDGDNTKVAKFQASGITTGTTRTLTIPDANTTIVGTDVTQTLTNKSLVDSSTSIVDDGDNTKVAKFQASGITTGTTRTFTLPDANTTVVGTDVSQTLTNKTLTDNSTIIADNSDATKQIKFDAAGSTSTATTITSSQTANRTLTLPDATDTLMGKATTDTMTNKTFGDAATFTQISTPSNPSAGLNKFYVKSDGFFYTLNSSGLEVRVGSGGSSQFTNFAQNPGFEFGTANWTASAGTFTTTSTAANLYAGNFSGSWTPNASNDTLTNTAVVITSGGGPTGSASASCVVKTAGTTHKLQAYDASTSSVLAEVTLPSTGTFIRSTINFTFPTSSASGVSLRILAGSTTVMYIDDCYLGEANNVGSSSFATNWVSETSQFTISPGYGTVTESDIYTRRVGDSLEVKGTWRAGTVSGTNAYLQLPSKYTIDTSKLHASQGQVVGVWNSALNATTTNYAGGDGVAFYDGSTTNQIFLGNRSTGQNWEKRLVNGFINNSDRIAVLFSVPIVEFAAQPTFRPDTAPAIWSGYHDTNCSWSRTNSAYGDPGTDASCTFTEDTGSIVNFPTVTSYQSGGNNLPGIVVTFPRAGKYYIALNTNYKCDAINGNCHLRLSDGTNTLASTRVRNNDTPTTATEQTDPVHLSAVYNATAAGSVTFRLEMASDGGAGSSINGNTSPVVRAVEWRILNATYPISAPVLVGSVTSNNPTGSERIERVYVTNSGTPAVSSQSGTWVSSITDNGTGDITLNIPTGIFSAGPSCICTNRNSSGDRLCAVHTATTTTAVRLLTTVSSTGTASDSDVYVICMGPR